MPTTQWHCDLYKQHRHAFDSNVHISLGSSKVFIKVRSSEKPFIAMQHKNRILLTVSSYQSLAGILFLLLLITSCSEDLNTPTIIKSLNYPEDPYNISESEGSRRESINSKTTTGTAENSQHGLAQELSKKFPHCEEAQKLCELLLQDSTNELAGTELVKHRTSSLKYAVICFHQLGADSAEYLAPIIQYLIYEGVAVQDNIEYRNTKLLVFDTILKLPMPAQALQKYLEKQPNRLLFIRNKLLGHKDYPPAVIKKLLTFLFKKYTEESHRLSYQSGNTVLHDIIKKGSPKLCSSALQLHQNGTIDLRWHLEKENNDGKFPWEIYNTERGNSLALQLFCETINLTWESDHEESLMWLVDDKKPIKNAYSIIRQIKNNEKLSKNFKEMLIKKIVSKLPKDAQRVYEYIKKDESDIAFKNKLIELCSLPECTSDMYDDTFLKKIITYELPDKKILNLLKKRSVSFKALFNNEKNIHATITDCRSLSTLIWLFKNLGIPKGVAIYEIILLVSLNSHLKDLEVSKLAKLLPNINQKCPELQEKLSDILCYNELKLEKKYIDKWKKYLNKKLSKKIITKNKPKPTRITRRENSVNKPKRKRAV